jgi:hypothetical protein
VIDRIIWTPGGIYVPAHLADTIRAAADAAGAYAPPGPGPGLDAAYLGTPIYIMPPTAAAAQPTRWWVRLWHRIARRRNGGQT